IADWVSRQPRGAGGAGELGDAEVGEPRRLRTITVGSAYPRQLVARDLTGAVLRSRGIERAAAATVGSIRPQPLRPGPARQRRRLVGVVDEEHAAALQCSERTAQPLRRSVLEWDARAFHRMRRQTPRVSADASGGAH